MRTMRISVLLVFVLLFGGAFVTSAQDTCDPELLELVITTLQAAQAAMRDGDQARAAELLTTVQTFLDPMISACGGVLPPEVDDATPEAPIASGEAVVIESQIELPNQFIASGDLFAFGMPEGLTYEESTTSHNGGSAITVRLDSSSGSDLPNNVSPYNVLIGDPFAIADWAGVIDADALAVGFEGISSFEAALSELIVPDDVQASDTEVYRITLAGHAGVAVKFVVRIGEDTLPLEALVYFVDYGDGVYGSFATLALEGNFDAQVQVMNAIALSMQLSE